MIRKFVYRLNETRMSSEKSNYNLELNRIGKEYEPFHYYYGTPREEDNEMDDTYYFILKSIPHNEYQPDGNKVTLLTPNSWKDNDNQGVKRHKLNPGDLNFNPDDYYFYKMVSTRRRQGEGRHEIHGVTVIYKDDNQARFATQLTQDGRTHFIVIEKDKLINSVRSNTKKRQWSGYGAEKTVADRFGWNIESSKIKKGIVKRSIVGGEIVPERVEDSVFDNILRTNYDEVLNQYENLFDIKNPDDDISKYDLVIPDGNYAGKKIEVKRYSAKSLFYIQGGIRPKEFMLAEQLGVKTKPGLRRLVKMYKDIVGISPEVDELLALPKDNILLSAKFSNLNKDEILQKIRIFYNRRISYMVFRYRRIPSESIMTGIFGIYFFNSNSGVDGFLIKSEDEGVKNFEYGWDSRTAHWGLDRVILEASVNPDAYRYVWLGDKKVFARTVKVSEFGLIPKDLREGDIILSGTDYGNIKWDHEKGYWVTTEKSGKINIKTFKSKYTSRSRSNL